ncbi:MAG: caspase family protein [Leptospiraceae bacterium]|nr:caspase family protein [Leptospiraceae bacterium]
MLLTDDIDLQSKKYPSAENIMGRLREILSGASENDLILVFFSGHGVTDKDGKRLLGRS